MEFVDANYEESAHVRRKNDISFVDGFHAKDLRKYIMERYEKDQGQILSISEMTVRRFFLPPNKKTSHSKYYKGLISIKQLGGMIK
jgi:hypothetical protein